MSGSDAPPLTAVLAFLSNVIVSVATMWFISIFLLGCSTCSIAPVAIILFFAFGVILVLSVFNLVLLLLPERKKH